MLEILLIIFNLLLFIFIFKEIYKLKKVIYFSTSRKKYLSKDLFQDFKNYLYIISAINSGMKINLEFNMLDDELLRKGLKDVSTNIEKIEYEILDLEKKLFINQ